MIHKETYTSAKESLYSSIGSGIMWSMILLSLAVLMHVVYLSI